MTSGRLARRSFAFYLRSHLGTIAGAAIATAVLTGALLVGDSVRESLRQIALARLGKVDFAMISGDRLFRAELARDIGQQFPTAKIAAALQLPGTASNPTSGARANQVQITGVDQNFWQLAPTNVTATLSSNSVWINSRLAEHLKVAVHETILVRTPTVSHLSRDAPLAPEEDSTIALRLQIDRIVSDEEFGRFGLQASQVPPYNVFVPLALLEKQVKATNQANLILLNTGAQKTESARFDQALRRSFTLADAQLNLIERGPAEMELRSSRVFLDNVVGEAALKTSSNAQPIFTYFVNQLETKGRATPYSMVTGDDALLPAGMKDDEIVINQWLADDLGAKPGDGLTVKYFVMGAMRDLLEKANQFRIRAIVPMQMPYADPSLMPDFPGMADAKNCRDWDTGFPINTAAIRDKDEDYWHKYRGSPKAFVTLHAAQQMWSNRFGNLTSVRYHVPPAPNLLKELQPSDIGLTFQPVRAQALEASSGSQDFGGLFIGFSFFLIGASLILLALMFRFGLEQRGIEIGTLLALGFTPGRVKRILILEGIGLAFLGSLIGAGCGVLYAKAMIHGLSTIWRDAIAGSALAYFAAPETLMTGFLAGMVIAFITIWWSLRKEVKRPARELLADGLETEFPGEETLRGRGPTKRRWVSSGWLGSICILLALGITGWGLAEGEHASGDLFFSAGGLMLIGGLAMSSAFIRRMNRSNLADELSLTGMGVRGITRRHRRSRASIGLLACGAFLVASIGAFRLDSAKNAKQRGSGTGGFEFIAEAAIPVVHNLNTQAGRDFYGLNAKEMTGVSFVPFRLLPGDDASCLNLNKAVRPRLLGVNANLLQGRHAFTFTKLLKTANQAEPWLALDADFGPGVVPAIGDAASIQYAMQKSVGDTIEYTDGNGKNFRVKIVGAVANSILQGSLIISEKQFVAHFPGESGYRMFLVDAPSNIAEALPGILAKAMQDNGLDVTRATDRLAAYNAVQNTYLGTFQLLGGLGLLLGSFGLGIVLLRNVFERRSELALLIAVGFRKQSLRWLILSEHAALLLIGLVIGIIAAAIAVLPALITPGRQFPMFTLAVMLGAILLCGLIWTVVSASIALRAPLLPALRNE